MSRILGRGGFGITYAMQDAMLGGQFAVKEYFPEGIAFRAVDLRLHALSAAHEGSFRWGLERFLDEARTLRRICGADGHPGIVTVRDYVEAFGTAYMVTDYCQGRDLAAVIASSERLDEPAILRLLAPLLDGLEHVHKRGIIHRDIKPANIMMRSNGAPVLLDFGAARQLLHQRTQAMTVILTPGYAPVEQYAGISKFGPWTDIYALGATLYHAITGAPPPDALSRIVEDTMMPAASAGQGRYDPRLLAGVDAALAVEPKARPQSVTEWRRILGIDVDGSATCPIHALGTQTPLGDFIAHQAALYAEGKVREMLRCARMARSIHGNDADLWNHEGVALSDLGRHREALDCFERSIEIRPSWVNCWCNKGRTLRALKRPDEALVSYDKGISHDPNAIIPYVNKGNCLCEDLGRNLEAAECYRRALSLEPRDEADRASLETARRQLAHIERRPR